MSSGRVAPVRATRVIAEWRRSCQVRSSRPMALRARANIVVRLPPVSGRPVLVPETSASRPAGVNRARWSASADTATAGRTTVRTPARDLRDLVDENRPPPVPGRRRRVVPQLVGGQNAALRAVPGVALARALDRARVGGVVADPR